MKKVGNAYGANNEGGKGLCVVGEEAEEEDVKLNGLYFDKRFGVQRWFAKDVKVQPEDTVRTTAPSTPSVAARKWRCHNDRSRHKQ